jgi:hypothetical protein
MMSGREKTGHWEVGQMNIFVSHIAEERKAAIALKRALESVTPQLSVWVSSLDIQPGQKWMDELALKLKKTKAIIVLCSAKSLERPWVNFESGFGAGKNVPVIPVCHSGLLPDQVPQPLKAFQALDLREARDCLELVKRLAQISGISAPEFDAVEMVRQLSPGASARSGQIGLSLAHGQGRWPSDYRPSLFAPQDAGLAQRWVFRELRSEDHLIAAEMSELSGLVVGSPLGAAMTAGCQTEIVEWVHGGGRLLLLGYELGDRHHNANLGALAQRFGLHPMPDIVGPSVDAGVKKAARPYGKEVALDPTVADPHDFTRDIVALRLANLQTVMLDPEATAWLKVGGNAVYRPARGSSIYNGDLFSQRGDSEVITCVPWIPVAAQAPSPLCGRGAVHFIGTWDLLPPQTAPADPRTILVDRLLNWLAGKEAR